VTSAKNKGALLKTLQLIAKGAAVDDQMRLGEWSHLTPTFGLQATLRWGNYLLFTHIPLLD
jgi:hypothetical protein